MRADRREAYEFLPTDDGHWRRAFDAQRLLVARGGIYAELWRAQNQSASVR